MSPKAADGGRRSTTGRIQICSTSSRRFCRNSAGKLRPLHGWSQSCCPLARQPTTAESGLPGYEVSIGVLAPTGIPNDVITRLNAEVLRTLATKEVRDSLSAQGFEPRGGSPEQFSALIVSDTAKWSRAIKASGAKLD
jgi:tripartite-type tricarboxylate transporter receptor subunit TctC